ncbi:malate dehydrogenase protein [Alternaria alternata]|nr:malate dehydrogenase protein [Alternaria alternata]
MDVEAMSQKTNVQKAREREWRLNTKSGQRHWNAAHYKGSKAHRNALKIPAFDRKIARISAYSRHKPFTQLAESGKVTCGKRTTLRR